MAKVTGIDGQDVAPDPDGEISSSTPFNYEAAEQAAVAIEAYQEQIDAIMEEANSEAAPIREKMADVYKNAAEEGATRKVIRYVTGERTEQRRRAEKFKKLSEEHQEQSVQLSFKLDKGTEAEVA